MFTGKWDWTYISECIDISQVRGNPNKPWNREGLSINCDLTIYDIDNLILPNAAGEWDWVGMSQWIDITQVREHPNRSWNLDGLSMNADITVRDIDLISNGLYGMLNIYPVKQVFKPVYTDVDILYTY